MTGDGEEDVVQLPAHTPRQLAVPQAEVLRRSAGHFNRSARFAQLLRLRNLCAGGKRANVLGGSFRPHFLLSFFARAMHILSKNDPLLTFFALFCCNEFLEFIFKFLSSIFFFNARNTFDPIVPC